MRTLPYRNNRPPADDHPDDAKDSKRLLAAVEVHSSNGTQSARIAPFKREWADRSLVDADLKKPEGVG
jgi:hypothetical protein